MRIELGPDGKIIGTRRVSPNGQVSGLSDFAGREVLVILPGGSESVYGNPWASGDDVMRTVSEQIRRAYEQYRALQEAYASPWEATRSFMEGMYGTPFPDLMAEVDRWVRRQVSEEKEDGPDGEAAAERHARRPSAPRPSARHGRKHA